MMLSLILGVVLLGGAVEHDCCCPQFATGQCYDVTLYPPGANIGIVEVLSSSGGVVHLVYDDGAGGFYDIWIGPPVENDPLCKRLYGVGVDDPDCQFIYCDPVGPPSCRWKWVDCINVRSGWLTLRNGCPTD